MGPHFSVISFEVGNLDLRATPATISWSPCLEDRTELSGWVV